MLVRVTESSQAGVARRTAIELAKSLALDDDSAGRVAIVAQELATNLIKHGGGGDLLVQQFSDADGSGIELLAIDKGSGMQDVGRCLEDGYSTAGSPGTGLGAMTRLSTQWEIHSQPGSGTVVLARIVGGAPSARQYSCQIGAIKVPYPGETACGDAWSCTENSGQTLLVVDGLGHGLPAAEAAGRAVTAFENSEGAGCVELATQIHRALLPTRGAAIALARIDGAHRLVRYVGIGNIAGAYVADGQFRRMVSHNGTAGHANPRIAEFTYPYSQAPTLILHTDGMSSRWDFANYPGLSARHPSVIAGVLYRDHRRGRDDTCVTVVRGRAA